MWFPWPRFPQTQSKWPKITYLGPSLLQVEQRPSTTPRQRTRTWAYRSASFQLYPIGFSSSSASHRQQFLGVPSFSSLGDSTSEPAGWFNSVLSARRVWPIQPHFLLKICSPIVCCSPRCQSYSLRIFSGHKYLRCVSDNHFWKSGSSGMPPSPLPPKNKRPSYRPKHFEHVNFS